MLSVQVLLLFDPANRQNVHQHSSGKKELAVLMIVAPWLIALQIFGIRKDTGMVGQDYQWLTTMYGKASFDPYNTRFLLTAPQDSISLTS